MDNLFDNIQGAAHAVVANTMGYAATWTPLAGGDTITGRVLLNKPTKTDKISDQEYQALKPQCEYSINDFPGLYKSVRDGKSEIIAIAGCEYVCYEGERKFDGKTILLTLEEREP